MRRECIIFVQVLFKVFLKLFGWSYLSLTYGCSVHFTYVENLVERYFLIIFLFQVYFDFA